MYQSYPYRHIHVHVCIHTVFELHVYAHSELYCIYMYMYTCTLTPVGTACGIMRHVVSLAVQTYGIEWHWHSYDVCKLLLISVCYLLCFNLYIHVGSSKKCIHITTLNDCNYRVPQNTYRYRQVLLVTAKHGQLNKASHLCYTCMA